MVIIDVFILNFGMLILKNHQLHMAKLQISFCSLLPKLYAIIFHLKLPVIGVVVVVGGAVVGVLIVVVELVVVVDEHSSYIGSSGPII